MVRCLCLMVGLVFAAGVHGQEKATKTGRFQLVPANTGYFSMIDTTSGECWAHDDGKWYDLKFPVKETKVTKGEIGRFQLLIVRNKEGLAVSAAVCDTTDGRCWHSNYDPGSMNWKALPFPAGKE